jgi:hypothetical protein
MNTHGLINIDRNELTNIDSLEAVNQYINSTLGRYNIALEIDWKLGVGFSKMVVEAQDRAGFSKDKRDRSAQFKKVQAIFINEGLNNLIEAVMRKFGYQPRFGGSTKAGVVSMKFVPEHKTQGEKADPVAKVANQMLTDKVQADRIKFQDDRILKLEGVLKSRGVVDIEAEVTSVE